MTRLFLTLTACAIFFAQSALAQSPALSMNTAMVSTQNPEQTETFNQQGAVSEIFAAQKQMTYHIMRKMGVEPESLPPEIRAEIARPQTTSVAALESFSAGIDALDKGNFADARMAFSQAAAADPGFSMAKSMQAAMPDMNTDEMIQDASGGAKPDKKAAGNSNAKGDKKADTGGKDNSNGNDKKDSKDDKGSKGKILVKRITTKAAAKTKEITQAVTSGGDGAGTVGGMDTFATPQEGGGDDNFGATVSVVSDTGSDDGSAGNVADNDGETTDLTNDQSVIDTYASGEEQNLVDGGTYSGGSTTTLAPITRRGVMAAFLSRVDGGGTVLVPYKPYITESPVKMTIDPDDNEAHSPIVQPGTYFELKQKDTTGYVKIDGTGAIKEFHDFYSSDLFEHQGQNLSVYPPDTFEGVAEFTIDLGNSETVELDFVTYNTWQSTDQTDYTFTNGGVPFVYGHITGNEAITNIKNDPVTANRTLQYSGSIFASVNCIGGSCPGGSGVTQQAKNGSFEATINFGSMQLTDLQTTTAVTTSDYGVSIASSGSIALQADGTFKDSSGTLGLYAGPSGNPAPIPGSVFSGATFGTNAQGIGGVFAGSADKSGLIYTTVGGFAGAKIP